MTVHTVSVHLVQTNELIDEFVFKLVKVQEDSNVAKFYDSSEVLIRVFPVLPYYFKFSREEVNEGSV